MLAVTQVGSCGMLSVVCLAVVYPLWLPLLRAGLNMHALLTCGEAHLCFVCVGEHQKCAHTRPKHNKSAI